MSVSGVQHRDSTSLLITQHSPRLSIVTICHGTVVRTILLDYIPDVVLFIFVSYLYKWKLVTLNSLDQFRPPPFRLATISLLSVFKGLFFLFV